MILKKHGRSLDADEADSEPTGVQLRHPALAACYDAAALIPDQEYPAGAEPGAEDRDCNVRVLGTPIYFLAMILAEFVSAADGRDALGRYLKANVARAASRWWRPRTWR